MHSSLRSRIALLAVTILLTACGGHRATVTVSEQGTGVRQPESEYRMVVAGDTLYSIAWEAGRDYRDLAKWNKIPPPYIVRPDEKIRLFPPRKAAGTRAHKKYRIVVAGDTLYSIAEDIGVSYRELAEWNNIPPPYLIKPGQALQITRKKGRQPASQSKPRSRNTRQKPKNKRMTARIRATSEPSAKVGAWVWPANGTILARFGANSANKGLDIAGKHGQPIRAAAAGQVVYTGGGLRGYGQLIIVKHNRDFLSAYAHCDRIYVEEGDVIKRGQKIAGMGGSGTDRVKLHFEIRYRGSPVDPVKYLPKR